MPCDNVYGGTKPVEWTLVASNCAYRLKTGNFGK